MDGARAAPRYAPAPPSSRAGRRARRRSWRVLEDDQRRPRVMNVGVADPLLDRFERRDAARARQRPHLHSGDQPEPARLVHEDVRALLAEDLLAGLGEDLDADLVAHRARRHEERRLAAEERGYALLQAVDGRVVAEHVVADLGLRHRAPHVGARARDGVAAEVRRPRRPRSRRDRLARADPRLHAAQPLRGSRPSWRSSAGRSPRRAFERRARACRRPPRRAARCRSRDAMRSSGCSRA